TLTAASATASVPKNLPGAPSVRLAASIAPTITIAEIALVTAISGVCSAGVTFQTTWEPKWIASNKMVRLMIVGETMSMAELLNADSGEPQLRTCAGPRRRAT